jgi:ATP-dependent DNA helicase Rep
MSLNAPQTAAVNYVDGPLLVLAGAGSGKTRVITEKIAKLVREGIVPAAGIAAITFTNKAAREMRERVARLLKGDSGEGLQISTFHALGLKFLQQEHAAAGLRRHFTVLGEDDSESLLKDLAPKGLKKDQLALFRHLISKAKSAGQSYLDLGANARSAKEIEAAALYKSYSERLQAFNAVDFDDLLSKPVAMLQVDEVLRQKWQQKWRYLLVDEYQDTNDTQYNLIRLLAGENGAFTAVGDDDQSIYAWRGANPENLAGLQRDYPHLRVIKLEQNYRCSGRILASANQLIANNPHIFEKKLWSALDEGEPIVVAPQATEQAESEFVAAAISNHRLLFKSQASAFAVLYRGNHQARSIELALRALKIPYILSGATSFFDRQEIRDLGAYLRLVANPDDDAAFLRAVRNPKREIGDTSLQRLGEAAQHGSHSLLHAARSATVQKSLQGRAAAALQAFTEELTAYQQLANQLSPANLLQAICKRCGYHEFLRAQVKDNALYERRKENIDEFAKWLEGVAPRSGMSSLESALQQLMLRDRAEDDGDGVRLMTLHSAKGLEFDHVYLLGLEDGLLPHQSAIDENRLEEERRLLYVGITRAKQTLTLSFCKTRSRYGTEERTTPSRFLAELPKAQLQWREDGGVENTVQKKQLANAHLAQLAELLKA